MRPVGAAWRADSSGLQAALPKVWAKRLLRRFTHEHGFLSR